MIKAKILCVLLPVILLAGCTSTPESCDPANRDKGLWDKLDCQFSGNYQQRIDDKEKILLDEQKANQQFKAIYASIEKQKNDSSLTLKQKQAEQKKLQQQLTQLTDEIKQKAKNRDDLQAKIDDIDQQVEKVNGASSSEIEKQVELDNLNKKLQSLQKALNL